jgi:hypothetical protein
MSDLINVNIRPHLVSFLFQELEGETQATYGDKKVKLARISRSSLLGQMIEEFKSFSGQKKTAASRSFSIFLKITDSGERTGLLHEKHNSNHSVLELHPSHVKIINDFFETIFRASIVEFVRGYAVNSNSKKFINEAVNQFMINHDLYLTEIDPETLRRYYYRAINRKHNLSGLQNQIGNRSFNYSG